MPIGWHSRAMTQRLDYVALNTPAISGMIAAKHHMATIPAGFRALVELRVSQINGCTYCIALHTKEATAAGEPEVRIASLPDWRGSAHFTAREKAALAWAETITRIESERAPTPLYDDLREHFSDTEIVDLTLIVSQMNAWNRLAISFEVPDATQM